MKSLVKVFGLASAAAFAAACASVGGGTGGTVTSGGAGPTTEPPTPNVIWPIKVREHVDLWLHGFAMLQEDTTFVPFFKRGYGTDMTVLKNRANVLELADTLWQRTYRPRMQRFFSNTQQAQGDILLSLPLDGEGRTQTNSTRS